MKCQTCSHPQREAIDLALLGENHTFAALSVQYGLSTSSLFRHKTHLVEKIRQAGSCFLCLFSTPVKIGEQQRSCGLCLPS